VGERVGGKEGESGVREGERVGGKEGEGYLLYK